MILGTAGHVDHGKTALVRALTGVDTDRLSEEKRRGITIDIGFAPLRLDDGTTIGVVDVPGHEAFVRNMLAGATGVDLALLVIAADEGVMPQTREHLAILTLLGVRAGVIALTKCDLAEPDWLELVREDVRSVVAGTPLDGAPMVATSVITGEGIEHLRAAIVGAARSLPERDGEDLFRLPVDRAFTVRGTGTVVTGTVWSGRLERDATVRLLPGPRTARVRGIESHGSVVPSARPGTRAAIALAGVEVGDIHRGAVVVTDPGWSASRTLLADVALLPDAPRPLGPRTAVRFHLGTVESGARIVTAGGALAPGARKRARVILAQPVVARAGDRFVLRAASPLVTIGGGVVHDPAPPHRRARPWSSPADTALERLAHVLATAGAHGVEVGALPVRLGAPPQAIAAMLGSTETGARRIADRLFAEQVIAEHVGRLIALVDEYHARAPLEPGAPLQSIRAQLGADGALADLALRELEREGRLEVSGALVRRKGWQPTLTAAERSARDVLLQRLVAAGREPPSVSELAGCFGAATVSLLRLLERDGSVVQVEADRYYAASSVEELIGTLRSGMLPGREYSPAELRDLLGFSRKYLIPFLEYCDQIGVTQRHSGGRLLGGRNRIP